MQGSAKHNARGEAESLEPAISKLVSGLKRDLQKKYGRVDYDKLRKDGYSELLLSRLHDVDPQNPLSSPDSSARPRQT